MNTGCRLFNLPPSSMYPANRPRLGVLSNVAFLSCYAFRSQSSSASRLRRCLGFGFSVGVRLAELIPGDTTRPLAIE